MSDFGGHACGESAFGEAVDSVGNIGGGGANVEEAQAGQSRADFIHKMEIALKELRETRYWLRLLVATELVKPERLAGLIGESEELVRVMSKIVVNAKRGKECKMQK